MAKAFLGRRPGAISCGVGLGARLGGDLLNYTLGSPEAFGRLRRGKAVELRADFSARAHLAEARRPLWRRLTDPQMPSSLTTSTPYERSAPFRLARPNSAVSRRHPETDSLRSEPILTGMRGNQLNRRAMIMMIGCRRRGEFHYRTPT